MTFPRSQMTTRAHERSYADPIVVSKGERVRIVKEDLWQGRHLWLWCVASNGSEGWSPASILIVSNGEAIVQQDYNAIELSVAADEEVMILREESGWRWVQNQLGDEGWIPLSCFSE